MTVVVDREERLKKMTQTAERYKESSRLLQDEVYSLRRRLDLANRVLKTLSVKDPDDDGLVWLSIDTGVGKMAASFPQERITGQVCLIFKGMLAATGSGK